MKLKSKQEEIFEVEKDVACRSVTVKNMVDDTGLDTPVPLPMVDSKILIKVIEYCKYHRTRFGPMRPPAPLFFRPRRLKSAAQASRTPPFHRCRHSPTTFRPLLTAPRLSSPFCRADKAEAETLPEDEKNVWDKDFVKVDDETLFNLILAANYLDIKSLLDLTCKTVADEIKGKTPEEIRVRFNIKNDFTPEECVAARPCPRPRFFVFASRTPSLTIVFLFCQLAGRKKSNERTHGARSAKPGGRAGSRLRGPTESPSVAYYA